MVICAYGFVAGGIQSLYNACVFEMSMDRVGGVVDHKKVKVRLALVLSMVGVEVLTGAPIGGALMGKMEGRYLFGRAGFCGGEYASRSVFSGWCEGGKGWVDGWEDLMFFLSGFHRFASRYLH